MNWRTIEKTRRDIEIRKKVLEDEIATREAEIRNLDWEWAQTCNEADQLLAARRIA